MAWEDGSYLWLCEGCGRVEGTAPEDVVSHRHGLITRARPGESGPVPNPCPKCGGDLTLWAVMPTECAGDYCI